jgi:hypothetical protein
MPPLSSIAAFAALSFALIVVPGPSVMFIVSRGVALGRRVALITALGNSAGVYVQMVFVALGLGAIVGRSIVAHSRPAIEPTWCSSIRTRGWSLPLLPGTSPTSPRRTD